MVSQVVIHPDTSATGREAVQPAAARFTKADRLRRRRDFERVKACGRRRQTSHFILSLADNDCGRPRLGIIVTKRLGKAVKRNRVKRLVREFFRRHKALLPPQDIVVIAKPEAVGLNYAAVQAELGAALLVAQEQPTQHAD